METGTVLKFIVFLAAIGGGVYGYQFYTKTETLRTQVRDLNLLVAQERDALNVSKGNWMAFEPLQTKAAEAAAKTASLKEQKRELEEKFKAAEAEFKALASSLGAAVDKVRADAATHVIPEIKLASGSVLKDVRLRKFQDGQVFFTHSAGIGPVPAAELPADLQERLDVGDNSLAKGVIAAEMSVLTGITHAVGLAVKCPVPLYEQPSPPNVAPIVETKQLIGKASEMEITVGYVRYASGTALNLDGAVAGAFKAVSGVQGISNLRQQTSSVTVSSFPAKRASFSAKRLGHGMDSEYLFILNGEKMWSIQVVYSDKAENGKSVAESIMNSIQVEPSH